MKRTTLSHDELRQGILQATENLFLELGFKAQVSLIVQRVGVAQGTFYNYFTSKEQALQEVFRNLWRGFLSSLEPCAPTGSALDQLRYLLASIFQPPSQTWLEPQRWQALMRLLEHPTAHELWDDARAEVLGPRIQQIVLAGIAEGVFQPYTYTVESTALLFGGINAYMHQHSTQLSDPRHVTAIQEVLARSLGIPPELLNIRS